MLPLTLTALPFSICLIFTAVLLLLYSYCAFGSLNTRPSRWAFLTFSSVSSYYVRLLAPASDVELEDWRATTTQRQHTKWEKLNLINMITYAMAKQYEAAVSIQYLEFALIDTFCYVDRNKKNPLWA